MIWIIFPKLIQLMQSNEEIQKMQDFKQLNSGKNLWMLFIRMPNIIFWFPSIKKWCWNMRKGKRNNKKLMMIIKRNREGDLRRKKKRNRNLELRVRLLLAVHLLIHILLQNWQNDVLFILLLKNYKKIISKNHLSILMNSHPTVNHGVFFVVKDQNHDLILIYKERIITGHLNLISRNRSSRNGIFRQKLSRMSTQIMGLKLIKKRGIKIRWRFSKLKKWKDI